jgi:hypothetical protein
MNTFTYLLTASRLMQASSQSAWIYPTEDEAADEGKETAICVLVDNK